MICSRSIATDIQYDNEWIKNVVETIENGANEHVNLVLVCSYARYASRLNVAFLGRHLHQIVSFPRCLISKAIGDGHQQPNVT